MFSVAYRILGSVAEAEDVVQEAFLKLHRSGTGAVDNLDAYATTVASRIAIDTVRSARVRREHYVGARLPESILDVREIDPARRLEREEALSTAFRVLLEALNPTERAVFVLREVLGYDYADVAAVVGKSEANCRQILARARRRLAGDSARRARAPEGAGRRARHLVAMLVDGDVLGLERILAADIAGPDPAAAPEGTATREPVVDVAA